MAKQESDWCKKIEIWWLLRDMKDGTSYRSKTIAWGDNGDRGSVGCDVQLWGDSPHVRFHYTMTRDSGEKQDFDYKIPLVTTPCRLGGHRYWFQCALSKNGVPCNRRVGVLYKGGDYFGCRHCYDLTYSSRKLSGYQKPYGRIISIPELEKLEKAVKRWSYRGKPTKRYLRYLKAEERFERGFIGVSMALSGIADKAMGKKGRKK